MRYKVIKKGRIRYIHTVIGEDEIERITSVYNSKSKLIRCYDRGDEPEMMFDDYTTFTCLGY